MFEIPHFSHQEPRISEILWFGIMLKVEMLNSFSEIADITCRATNPMSRKTFASIFFHVAYLFKACLPLHLSFSKQSLAFYHDFNKRWNAKSLVKLKQSLAYATIPFASCERTSRYFPQGYESLISGNVHKYTSLDYEPKNNH